MSEWYYARGGTQSGPVSFNQLKELASSGGIDSSDLVWTSSMKDWQPAAQVEGLIAQAMVPNQPSPDPSNPYSAPQSAWQQPSISSGESLPEITPGSDPIDVGACVKRGFDLTKRNFGMILLVGVVYFAVYMGFSILCGIMTGVAVPALQSSSSESSGAMMTFTFILQIISTIFSLYLGLGITRIGLNFVSGKEVTIGQMFGEADKLPRMVGASILYYAMVIIGCLLLIFPGIYLALRFMYYQMAIVDRNMGVMESLTYSSSLTTNNRLNLFLLGLLSFAVMIAGLLALFVGIFFAMPVVWLGWIVAYRWMQYGRRAAEDHPGTSTPLLTSI